MRMLFSCMILLLCFCSDAISAGTIVLNTADEYPLSTIDNRGYVDMIISEAFKRLGLVSRIVHLPSERALVNANAGIDDGNFVRIAGLEKSYPDLVMVPEMITEFEFTAFTKDPSIRIRGWSGLKPYRVGIITGWKILEAKVVGTRSLTKAGDPDALFAMLAGDRVDVVVFDRRQGLAVIKRLGIAGVKPLLPALARQDMFLYLNRRHAPLAPKLANVLREMKRDASFERIVNSVMRKKE